MKQLLQLCLLIGLLSACNGNSETHSDKEPLIQKESDSKTKIIGTWMLLSIGEEEADPGYTVSFFKDGKSITKGGEQDIESSWSIKTEDGVEILNVVSEDNLISNEIKKLDSKTLILQDGPDQVVFTKQ